MSLRNEKLAESVFFQCDKADPQADEQDGLLREYLRASFGSSRVAVGSKAPFLLAVFRYLVQQQVMPNELELRLFRLARYEPDELDNVHNPAVEIDDWIEEIIRGHLT